MTIEEIRKMMEQPSNDKVLILAEECLRLHAVIAQHDLCHNLHGKVDAQAFADGCAAEQRKLYGCAPDRDKLNMLQGSNQ